jgi:hypothetical protein
VLIFTLVVVAFALALAATGPAIGNVFSNTVYNLLGQTTTPRALADADDFWLTVTWVATQTPQEYPLPTRTIPPPPPTITPGPSPTNTPVTPTSTPTQTFTPGPTSTPTDLAHAYPFTDKSNNLEWWRLDTSFFLGSDDWRGYYYANRTLTPPVAFDSLSGAPPNEANRYKINYNWPSGTGPGGGSWNDDNFSVKFIRKIYLPNSTTLRITVTADDGVRMWYNYSTNCSGLGSPALNPGVSGSAYPNDRVFGDSNPNPCLLLNDWQDQSPQTWTIIKTFPAGEHTLQVDYYDRTGSAQIKVDIANNGIRTNPDDKLVSGVGSPDCNWGRHPDSRNSNTLDWMWEEYVSGDFAQNAVCHIELAGYVDVPVTAVNPEFSFWDIWDYRNTSNIGWIEFAEWTTLYTDDAGTVNPARTAPGYWKRVNLHNAGGGNTINYNWTRSAIDLNTVFGGSVAGKKITWRFGMQNASGGSNTRRWYIDDVYLGDTAYKNFRIGQIWNLDTPEQAGDFITTGRWELTNKNKKGSAGNSWEDSPGGSSTPGQGAVYDRHNEWDTNNTRVHSVEFKGFIDTADVAGTADIEGDTGIPMLSFYHAYEIGQRVWLEVQYTTSPYGVAVTNWQPVPSGDPLNPYGAIVPQSGNGSYRSNTTLSFVEIPLDQIPATRFRLRFAMMVRYDANQEDGWWIDDIYLERKGVPKYTAYPFFDNAEGGITNWQTSGTWDRVQGSVFYELGVKEHSFSDSPGINYPVNSNASLILRYPFDLNSDSPTNPTANGCTLGGECQTPAPAAVKPYMTFWHWRGLAPSDALYVEYKKIGDADTPANWKPLWAYRYGMTNQNSSPNGRTGTQLGWERVEIDLSVIPYSPTDGAKDDDDVQIRFRLFSDGGSVGDGVAVDDVFVGEYTEKSFKLWPTSVNPGGFGNGNGTALIDDIDAGLWFERWWNGGGWQKIEWEQHGGLSSFHDSVSDSTGTQDTAPPDEPLTVVQINDTYSVLEMQTIVDLRGTDVADGPTLYYWNRYYTGDDDFIRTQVSVELSPPATNPCSDATLPQCYEHRRGWSEWAALQSIGQFTRNYTWVREQISLDTYAGKRIRIRFIVDALDTNANRDGWYIDDITIRYRNPPRLIPIPFSDSARNLSNWIAEGKWGLDPELFRGGGGGPASLGAAWFGYWWNCVGCTTGTFSSKADAFLDARPNNQSPDQTEVVLDIIHDVGFGNLFCDAASPFTCRRDAVVGRWQLTTPPVDGVSLQAGDYTFITVSDDGVRMRYDTVPAGGVPPVPEWNIINNWTDHGRTVDMGTATLQGGNRYKFTLEYYEKSSSAVIILTLGSNTFSFTDSPKQGTGPSFPDIPAVKRGNSSLMLNGLLDLSSATTPVMEYYTYYELAGIAWVEISPDGGFTWGASTIGESAYRNALGVGAFDDPKIDWQIWMPNNGDWQRRQHDLSLYAGETVGLRFRLDRTGTDCLSADNTCNEGGSGYNANGRYASWWVTDIRVIQP